MGSSPAAPRQTQLTNPVATSYQAWRIARCPASTALVMMRLSARASACASTFSLVLTSMISSGAEQVERAAVTEG